MLNHEPSMADVMSAVQNFEKYIVGIVNNNCGVLAQKIDAMIAVLETKDHSFRPLYDRAVYMQKCMQQFRIKAAVMQKGGPNALPAMGQIDQLLAELKKEGKENGWQSTFNNAKQRVVKEGLEVKEPKLEVVEK